MPHNSDKSVRNWIICIGGYMQNRSLSTQGICGLAKQLRDRYDPRVATVDYNPWKTDWAATAEWIYRWSGFDHKEPNGVSEPPTIMIVAYSWGAGWGLVQLAQHLAYRGLKVQLAVATDAVRHVGWTWCHSLGVSQVLAFWPYWHIERPSNIREFYWFRQGRTRGLRGMWSDFWNGGGLLYGHTWVERAMTVFGSTDMISPNGTMVPDVNHAGMDDADEFRTKTFELADSLFLKTKRAAW